MPASLPVPRIVERDLAATHPSFAREFSTFMFFDGFLLKRMMLFLRKKKLK
jgi:hypothetical protein